MEYPLPSQFWFEAWFPLRLSPFTLREFKAVQWEFLMWPTHEDAVVMYARFCRAHYGFNAYEKVKKRATQLARSGDLVGEKIWSEVAAEIKKNPTAGRPLFSQ